VVLAADGTPLRLVEAAMGRELLRFPEKAAEVTSFTLAPDGKWLCAVAPGQARLWDVATGKELRLLRHPALGREAGSVVVSPDGRTLLVARPTGPAQLWDAAAAKPLFRLAETDGPQPVALAPDGRLLAVGGTDGLVRLWRTAPGDEVRRFEWHPPPKEEGGA